MQDERSEMGTLTRRILRALQRGPLYEGTIPLVVGATVRDTGRALSALRSEGLIERTGDGYTWQVTP